jgi:thioredoxin 1
MTPGEFFNNLEGKTLLHFTASWCTPCRLMEPYMAEFLGDNPKVNYIKIDVDDADNSEMVNEFAIKSVPTLFSFEGTQKVKYRTSALNKVQIESMWELYE